jgi:YidC/Oxa1 family membrane protein insertase
VFDLFATILAWFYALTHNYAIAIAMLTLCVMIVLTPLTLKGTKSMLQLQKLQPQVKRLQAEHKGDRQKLNEEMMALYKENRINPLSGCLPLLLQAPIFFILYRVLSGLTRTCPSDGEIGGVSCSSVGSSVGTFFPDYVKQSSELFQSLVGKTQMLAFGLDLSKPATKQLSEGFINGLPYLILVLVVGALSYYQQRQVSSRMKDNVNPQQQMIMKVLPAFFALISLTLPAGLIVYFLTSSCYRIAQQAYITRRFYRDEGSGGDDSGNGAKKGKPAPKPTPTSTSKPKPEPKPEPAVRPTPKRPTSGRATPPQRATNPNRPRPTPRPPTRPAPKKK